MIGKIGNKDIFRKPKTEKKPANEEKAETDSPKKAGRGRPKVHEEPTVKTVVTLRKSQLLWLDRLALEVREHTDKILDRGLLMRAFIDAVHESKLDLSGIASEEDAVKLISEKLKKR